MVKNAARKKAIRRIMEERGITYMQAMRINNERQAAKANVGTAGKVRWD